MLPDRSVYPPLSLSLPISTLLSIHRKELRSRFNPCFLNTMQLINWWLSNCIWGIHDWNEAQIRKPLSPKVCLDLADRAHYILSFLWIPIALIATHHKAILLPNLCIYAYILRPLRGWIGCDWEVVLLFQHPLKPILTPLCQSIQSQWWWIVADISILFSSLLFFLILFNTCTQITSRHMAHFYL